jgi:hypothetical protein
MPDRFAKHMEARNKLLDAHNALAANEARMNNDELVMRAHDAEWAFVRAFLALYAPKVEGLPPESHTE